MWFSGTQRAPDLADTRATKYIQANIDCRRRFLEGLEAGKADLPLDAFLEWLHSLHAVQAYKGGEGEVGKGRYVADAASFQVDLDRIATRYGDPYLTASQHVIELPDVATPDLPQLVHANGFSGYMYPLARKECMREVQGALRRALDLLGSGSKEAFVRAVGELAYFGITPHYFQGTNASLFMNLTNALLGMGGLHGIEHGILDFAIMAVRKEAWLDYFQEEVARVNGDRVSAPPRNLEDIDSLSARTAARTARVERALELPNTAGSGRALDSWRRVSDAITETDLMTRELAARIAEEPESSSVLDAKLGEAKRLRDRVRAELHASLQHLPAQVDAIKDELKARREAITEDASGDATSVEAQRESLRGDLEWLSHMTIFLRITTRTAGHPEIANGLKFNFQDYWDPQWGARFDSFLTDVISLFRWPDKPTLTAP
jgi:hypothetical protein